ncbi:MAG: iron ABC transporter permease [Phycisphaerales bacterium]|nr:iron ABC transporter permease [Phycisphaerales bacterium]
MRRPLSAWPNYGLLFALLAVLGVLLLYPVALTVQGAFYADPVAGPKGGLTLANLARVFENPVLVEGVVNSLRVAAATTTLAVLIGLPLAVLSTRYKFPGKRVFNAVVLVPMILPPFVGAIGFKAVMGSQGAVNALLGTEVDFIGLSQFWGVCMVQALTLYPVIYLNACAALANLDPALDECAENLGAGFWRRFLRVTLPLIRPGLFAGGPIVFIWSFTELGTPLVFEYRRVMPVQVFDGLKEVERSAEPYALVVVMLSVAVSCYILGKAVFGRAGHAMFAKASRAGEEQALTGWRGWTATGAFTVVALLALLPHLGVIGTALSGTGQWYRSVLPRAFTLSHFNQALTSDLAAGSITMSLMLSLSAVLLALGIGLLVGYLLVRSNIKGLPVLDALTMLPLAVPGLVLAFGYVAMSLRWPFGKGNPLESLNIVGAAPNPVPFLIAAYAVRRLPYIVRATVAGLQQTSGQLEEAAMNLGASRVTAVRRVIVPLIAANLIAGGLLAFAFSMLEVSDSLILAQQERHFPITKAIFAFANRLADGPHIASAMGVWGMALLGVTLVGATVMMGKRMGAIFRA